MKTRILVIAVMFLMLATGSALAQMGGGSGGMGGGGSGGMGGGGSGDMGHGGSGGMDGSGSGAPGGGMHGSGDMRGSMGSGPGDPGHGHGMTPEQRHAMTPMIQDMNNMMKAMSETMKGNVPHDNVAKMSQIMKDMSKQMADMSRAMDRGKLSDKQLRAMQDRMTHMKETLEEVQRK